MGISTNVYTYYGVKVPWDDKFSDAYDEAYDDPDCPNVLIDGMSGEYMIFGQQLFDSGDFRWGLEDGDAYKEIDITSLPVYEKEYKEAFLKKFPQFSHYMDIPFRLICFTHFS